MPLVSGDAQSLLEEANAEQLHRRLRKALWARHYDTAKPGEVEAWKESLRALLEVLRDAGLGETEVLIEYSLPRSSLRVDAIICGVHPSTEHPSFVFVELKRWSTVFETVGNLVRQHRDGQLTQHPADQVRGYCEYMRRAVPALAEDQHLISGIAYLHNAHPGKIRQLLPHKRDHWGRMYTLDDRKALVGQLRLLLDKSRSHEDNLASARTLLTYPARPSAQLLEMTRKAVAEREFLLLVDQQRTAYDLVEAAAVKANEGTRKTVVVVEGRPGSGKSAIAMTLLGRLRDLGMEGYHSTGSKSFTETMRRYVGARGSGVRDMFKYNHNFRLDRKHELDIIICDEAQRLRRTSTHQRTPRAVREQAEPQIKELISAARVPVFLLDEDQRIRPDDVGSIAEISRIAHELDCLVEVVSLRGQFRCGGCDAYDQWVDRLLGVNAEPPEKWSSFDVPTTTFHVEVATTPRAMENWLTERFTVGETARMTAGYCWKWQMPKKCQVAEPDITIGEWSRPWNARRSSDDAPLSNFWATDPKGFGQVGCIYTAQGFEYDWAGVIFGPDLVWRTDRWVVQPKESHDREAKKDKELFPELVRNAYRVLLTRGLRGVSMYSVDDETQRYLQTMVG